MMRAGGLGLALAIAVAACGADKAGSQDAEGAAIDAPVTVYENGRWWTGEGFEAGTRFVAGGAFVERGSGIVSTRIDLADAYVTPPLGDAHMHGFEDTGQSVDLANAFLADGVAYVAALGQSPRDRDAVDACLAAMGGPDVLYANGMITSPGGHPVLNYEAQAAGKPFWQLSEDERAALIAAGTRKGDAYWTARDAADVDDFWPDYIDQSPDIVKIIIAGEQGLSRAAVMAVAAKAREAGLPVYAHIQTTEDLALALEAGVDVLAHAPDYNAPVDPMSSDRLQRLAASGTPVTPTFGRELAMERFVPEQYRKPAEEVEALRRSHAARLSALAEAGVSLLAGFDLNDGTALDELIYWQKVGGLPGAAILNAGMVATPQALFPGRRVGCLEIGCEASFLVMPDDPSTNIAVIRDADMRVILGQPVTLPLQPC